ncbi:alanine dehydrogenase [Dehalococcoidia bacterium]|nr:alanine dehydrogenase [Dehalococcoidia bacterium]
MRRDLSSVAKRNRSSTIPEVLLLSRSKVEELLDTGEVLKAVEQAFVFQAKGKALMPPKLYLELPQYQGDFRAMPAYIDGSAGVKWVSVYPDNCRRDLLSVVATIILCDPNTGYPLAIIDGTYITDMRTGAAGGVAVKHLARRDSSIIGIIGAGMQARTQLLAISEVLPRIDEVKVFDQCEDASRRYAEEMGTRLNLNVRYAETIGEATEADIVVTTTPSRKPIVKRHHIRPGTHINAIGADAKGKQELEADLLKDAKIIVDEIEQAAHSGEINVPLSEGVITLKGIYGTLGEVVAEKKRGRENDEEITIFDSTGLAIQDIICAKLVYEKAVERDVPVFELL